MLQRTFKGRWEKIREEHDSELAGHEVTLIVADVENIVQPAASERKPESLYDRMKGHIGKFNFGDANLSQNTSEKFTEILEEKRRQGHL